MPGGGACSGLGSIPGRTFGDRAFRPCRSRARAGSVATGNKQGRCEMSGIKPRYLSANEAAVYLGLSARTLSKMRIAGDGPPYSKVRRKVLYDMAALDEWMGRTQAAVYGRAGGGRARVVRWCRARGGKSLRGSAGREGRRRDGEEVAEGPQVGLGVIGSMRDEDGCGHGTLVQHHAFGRTVIQRREGLSRPVGPGQECWVSSTLVRSWREPWRAHMVRSAARWNSASTPSGTARIRPSGSSSPQLTPATSRRRSRHEAVLTTAGGCGFPTPFRELVDQVAAEEAGRSGDEGVSGSRGPSRHSLASAKVERRTGAAEADPVKFAGLCRQTGLDVAQALAVGELGVRGRNLSDGIPGEPARIT